MHFPINVEFVILIVVSTISTKNETEFVFQISIKNMGLGNNRQWIG